MPEFKTVHCEKCNAPILTAQNNKDHYHKKHTVYCCNTEYHIRYNTNRNGELTIEQSVVELPNIDISPFQTTEYPFEESSVPAKLG